MSQEQLYHNVASLLDRVERLEHDLRALVVPDVAPLARKTQDLDTRLKFNEKALLDFSKQGYGFRLRDLDTRLSAFQQLLVERDLQLAKYRRDTDAAIIKYANRCLITLVAVLIGVSVRAIL